MLACAIIYLLVVTGILLYGIEYVGVYFKLINKISIRRIVTFISIFIIIELLFIIILAPFIKL